MFTQSVLGKIVLGHNPFFGVDHLSTTRGQQREREFAKVQGIIDIITYAVDKGASGMMLSTHSRSTDILTAIRDCQKLRDNLQLYPLLPYAQKYVTAANEKGLFNVIMDTITQSSGSELFGFLKSGAQALLKKDMYGMLKSLIAVELRAFKGLPVHAVFLHDVCTDLLLALGLKDVLYAYVENIEKNSGWKAAFTTKNLPLFLARMKEWGINDPIVMTHINKLGYSMNPSRQEVEESLQNQECHIMAMSTLASGYLTPKDAYQYIGSLGSIESIVVGASSRSHIEETFENINLYLKPI